MFVGLIVSVTHSLGSVGGRCWYLVLSTSSSGGSWGYFLWVHLRCNNIKMTPEREKGDDAGDGYGEDGFERGAEAGGGGGLRRG